MAISPPVFDERVIKAEFLTKLWREGTVDRTTVLSSEYRLQDTGVRADLAILTDQLVGVEIKSGKDSLKRLRQQMAVYVEYFDHVILVLAPKHLANLKDEDIRLVELWSFDSARNFRMLKKGVSSDRAAARFALLPERDRRRYAHLTDRAAFDMIFRERFHQTSDQLWKSVGRSGRVPADSLKYLSRFREIRETHLEWQNDRERRWSEWTLKAEQAFSSRGPAAPSDDQL